MLLIGGQAKISRVFPACIPVQVLRLQAAHSDAKDGKGKTSTSEEGDLSCNAVQSHDMYTQFRLRGLQVKYRHPGQMNTRNPIPSASA